MADKFEKFAFETDFFDVAVMDGLITQPKLPKTAQEGYDKGFKEGLAQGRAEGDTLLQNELTALKHQLTSLMATLTQRHEQWQNELTQAAINLVRQSLHKIIGHATAHYSDQMLETHIRELLALLHQGDGLTLRINPQAKAYHEKLGLPQASIGNIPFKITTDPALGPTDVVMEWPSGGLEAKLADHMVALDALLAHVGADTAQPTEPLPTTTTIQSPADTSSPLDAASQQTSSRAKQLLGDDELVDALK